MKREAYSLFVSVWELFIIFKLGKRIINMALKVDYAIQLYLKIEINGNYSQYQSWFRINEKQIREAVCSLSF